MSGYSLKADSLIKRYQELESDTGNRKFRDSPKRLGKMHRTPPSGTESDKKQQLSNEENIHTYFICSTGSSYLEKS